MQDSQDSTPEFQLGTDPVVVTEAHRRAFAITDELNVHGVGCVCPRCAARLPGLLTELARAIEQAGGQADVGEPR
jgi:hypothetical protein